MMSLVRIVEDGANAVDSKKAATLDTMDKLGQASIGRMRQHIENAKRKILQSAPHHHDSTSMNKRLKESAPMKMTSVIENVNKENASTALNQKKTMSHNGMNGGAGPVKPKMAPKPAQTVNRTALEFKVNAMRVVDLRKELKERDLPSAGRKKELIERLLDAMLNTPEDGNDSGNDGADDEDADDEPGIIEIDVNGSTVHNNANSSGNAHGAPEPTLSRTTAAPHARAHPHQEEHLQPDCVDLTSSSDEPIGESEERNNGNHDNPAADGSNANDTKHRAMNMTPGGMKHAHGYPPSTPSNPASGYETSSDVGSNVGSNVSSTILPSMRVSGNKVREMVSKLTGSSSTTSQASSGANMNGGISAGAGSSSALSESVKKKQMARTQRMLELRGNSKPLASSKPITAPKEYTSTLSSLKTTSSTVSNMKKKNLAAQMREKAASNRCVIAGSSSNNNAGTGMSVKSVLGSASKISSNILKNGFKNNQNHHSHGARAGSSARPTDGTESHMQPSVPAQSQPKPQAQPLPPKETYEMSDREDSDTDDDSDSEAENEKRKKKIPTWASRSNLQAALIRQFGDDMVDPDKIFHPVQSCDLEAIFSNAKKKSKYSRRNSSGNWANDCVTQLELDAYRRTMGFADGQHA